MIKLKDVTKYYYSDSSVTLGLQRINLEFKLGEFVAITGESGSGKSTLLNVISGMDTYEEGELYFGEQETSCFSEEDWEKYRRNHISLIYQSYNLIDSYTALENIESVLLICEETLGKMTKKERCRRALEVLKSVGLEKYANHKASHLSSGQKQRLGIARALAKDTDIIIADEPTGNLDIENGKAVMEILHKLSKDKLVIVVTHNYEQAEPYVTRKVRLYDGEVAENIEIKKADTKDEEEAVRKLKARESEKPDFMDTLHTAMRFVIMNQKGQPHRTFFMFTFILLATLAVLIFAGTLSGAGDDTQTKNISRETFYNISDDRLIVRRIDGEPLTAKDYDIIKDIANVESVDEYDGANDVYYVYKLNEDYSLAYESMHNDVFEKKELVFKEKNKFVRSATCLLESDLSEGRLPEKVNEIVLYSSDDSMLGKEIDFYFYRPNHWSVADYVGVKMTVVGILKENEGQVYFADNLAKSFNVRYDHNYYTDINIHRETTDKETGEVTVKEVLNKISATFVMNDTLEDDQIRISSMIFDDLWITDGRSTTVEETVLENAVVGVRYNNGALPYTADVRVIQNGTLHSSEVVEVSEKIFNEIFVGFDNIQCSVFIRDYAYTDQVIEDLADSGYEAISVIRYSATTYNDAKLQEKMLMIGISAGATVVIFFLGIFVLTGMLRMKKGDFFILRSLGLDNAVLKKVNYINVTILSAISLTLVIAAVNILAAGSDTVNDIVKYMTPLHYVYVVVICILMALLSAFRFNRYLLKTFRITVLREE